MSDFDYGASVPKTVDAVVEWFGDTHDEADLRKLLTLMTSKTDRWGDPITPGRAWSLIVEHTLLYRDHHIGWVTREGKMLSCDWAYHEKLLDHLGLDAWQVEAAGWARVALRKFQCTFRMSKEQRLRVEACGCLVDRGEEELKPEWTPPAEPVPLPF